MKSLGCHFYSPWNGHCFIPRLPFFNTSAVTNFDYTWAKLINLLLFPKLNISSGTSFSHTWEYCESLTNFPILDTSNGKHFNHCWFNCKSLIEFPILDLSKGTHFNYAWYKCESLIEFPSIQLPQNTSCFGAWGSCTNLEYFPPNVFDNMVEMENKCFVNSWSECKLSTESVENILVSINKAKINTKKLGPHIERIDIGVDNSFKLNKSITKSVRSLINKGFVTSINDRFIK